MLNPEPYEGPLYGFGVSQGGSLEPNPGQRLSRGFRLVDLGVYELNYRCTTNLTSVGVVIKRRYKARQRRQVEKAPSRTPEAQQHAKLKRKHVVHPGRHP